MGADAAPATARPARGQDRLLTRYARLMAERYGARLYLFGSRARGTTGPESDYDLVAVAESFVGQRRIARAPDRYRLWREAGGFGITLDLHCYTPEEFREELAGLGYLGQARRRRELVEVEPTPSASPRTAAGSTRRTPRT